MKKTVDGHLKANRPVSLGGGARLIRPQEGWARLALAIALTFSAVHLYAPSGLTQEVQRTTQQQILEQRTTKDDIRVKRSSGQPPVKRVPPPVAGPGDTQPPKRPVATPPLTSRDREILARAWKHYQAEDYRQAAETFGYLNNSSDDQLHLEAMFGLGLCLRQLGERDHARELFMNLARKGYRLKDTEAQLAQLQAETQALSLSSKEFAQSSREASTAPVEAPPTKLSAQDRRRIAARAKRTRATTGPKLPPLRERDRLLREMSNLSSTSPNYRTLAQRLLVLDPDNRGIRAGLAWACYNDQDYACAREQFEVLVQRHPEFEEYLMGWGQSLVKLGDTQEALQGLEQSQHRDRAPVQALIVQIRKEQAHDLYRRKDYAAAEARFQEIVAHQPEDSATWDMLGWSRYHGGNPSGAAQAMRRSFDLSPSAEQAGNVLMTLDKAKLDGQAQAFTNRLATAADPALNKVAADRYFQHRSPILAVQTYAGNGTCYRNCDSPWLETGFAYYEKSGDTGLSQLSAVLPRARLHYPIKGGRELYVDVAEPRLDSGQAPPTPYAGSYYRHLDAFSTGYRTLLESLWTTVPELGFRQEGTVSYALALGTTPLNGPVTALPTFRAEIQRENDFFLQAHQCPITESILSWVGQRDPYGAGSWGRVVKSGVQGSKTFSAAPYWLTTGLVYDYYWGHGVVDNHAVSGTISAGRADPFLRGELTSGIFLTLKHFEENTDFFTLGHGGYFSPQLFVIGGPFLRYEKFQCHEYWIDVQGSVGYMYFETNSAPHYHGAEYDLSSISTSAMNDLLGYYDGETKSGLSVNIAGQAFRLIHDHLAVGGFFAVNQSPNYNEWMVGVALQIYLEPHEGLCARSDLIQQALPCR